MLIYTSVLKELILDTTCNMEKLKEKMILLFTGTVVSTLVVLITFLVSSYFGDFVTKAEYNKDKADIAVIKTDLQYLRKGQDDIKKLLQ